jgi:hypothetical protein
MLAIARGGGDRPSGRSEPGQIAWSGASRPGCDSSSRTAIGFFGKRLVGQVGRIVERPSRAGVGAELADGAQHVEDGARSGAPWMEVQAVADGVVEQASIVSARSSSDSRWSARDEVLLAPARRREKRPVAAS